MRHYVMALLGLVLSSCINGQITTAVNDLDNANDDLDTTQTDLIYKHTKLFPNHTQLSIALISNGQVRFVGVIRSNDTIQLTNNSHLAFEIGSITKVFTATLLSDFVVDQQLQLDDPIQNYLDVKFKTNQPITFKQLANHTSGLPRMPSNLNFLFVDRDNPYKNYDSQQLTDYLSSELKLSEEPGFAYAYSNLGAGLLGFTLSAISNTTYEDLLQEKVFKKYGMHHSTSKKERLKVELVKGLDPDGETTSNWDFDALAGGGAIFSTVEDLSQFALAQYNKTHTELQLTQQPTFTVNTNMKMGLGWHIIKRKNGRELLWHNGGTGGYTSSMALDTEHGNGVVILSNVSAFNDHMGRIDQLCFELINTLL